MRKWLIVLMAVWQRSDRNPGMAVYEAGSQGDRKLPLQRARKTATLPGYDNGRSSGRVAVDKERWRCFSQPDG